MSETLWGVVVGGVIVIVGNLVAGLFQRHLTRVNIDARRNEQTRQFEFEKAQKTTQLDFEKDQKILQLQFDKEQQIIARLIEERKKWIIPLRSTLIEYSKNVNRANDQIFNIRYSIPDSNQSNPKPFALDSDITRLRDIVKEWDTSWTGLMNTMSQISDQQLKDIINRLVIDQVWITSGLYINIDKDQCLKMETIAKRAKETVAGAFKRMEELLSGAEEYKERIPPSITAQASTT